MSDVVDVSEYLKDKLNIDKIFNPSDFDEVFEIVYNPEIGGLYINFIFDISKYLEITEELFKKKFFSFYKDQIFVSYSDIKQWVYATLLSCSLRPGYSRRILQ